MNKRTFLHSLFALPVVVAVPALLKQQAAFGLQAGFTLGGSFPSYVAGLTGWYKAVHTQDGVAWRDMLTGKDGRAPSGYALAPTEVRVYAKAHDAETRRAIIQDMLRHTA